MYIGPNLGEDYKNYIKRVLNDGGVYTAPKAVEFQKNIENTLKLSPSLFLLPNSGKAGKLYSVLPDTGAGDFTVSRNGQATYFDKNGVLKTAQANEPRFEFDPLTGVFKGVLVEPSATNLLLRSEQFDNAYWSKSNLNIGISAFPSPSGGQAILATANLDLSGSGISRAGFTQIPLNNFYTLSCFVRKTTGWLNVRTTIIQGAGTNNSGRAGAWFNLSNGNIGTIINGVVGQTLTASVLDLGDYLRLSIRFFLSLRFDQSISFRIANADNSDVASINDSITIWGAQLEEGSAATSYIPTVASTVTRPADIIDVTVPAGVTSIDETVNGVTTTITSIPVTYQLPNGHVSKVIMA